MSRKLRSRLSLLTIFTFVSVSSFSVVSMAAPGKGHEKNIPKKSFYSMSINSVNNHASDKSSRPLIKSKTPGDIDFKVVTTTGAIEFHGKWNTTPGAIGFHGYRTTPGAIEFHGHRTTPGAIEFHGHRTTSGAIELDDNRTTTPGAIHFHDGRTTPGGIEFREHRTTPGAIEFDDNRTTPGGIELHRNKNTSPTRVIVTPKGKSDDKRSNKSGRKHR